MVPNLIGGVEGLLPQWRDEQLDLIFSDRPLVVFPLQFEETIPFMTGNFKTVFSDRARRGFCLRRFRGTTGR